MSRFARAACVALGGLVLLSVPAGVLAQQAPKLVNPGFEDTFKPVNPTGASSNAKAKISGQVADGWLDNSGWASVAIDYAQVRDNPHGGQTAQRVHVKQVTDGAAQFVHSVLVKEAGVYRFRVWLRGAPGSTLILQLRQGPAPYALYAQNAAELSDGWKPFEVVGRIPANTQLSLMLRSTGAIAYVVDDASFEAVDEPAAGAVNLVNGGSFEAASLPYGWNWQGERSPVIDATTAAVGKQSLKIETAGSMTFVGSHLIDAIRQGKTYTLSVWLKSDQPGTAVNIQLERAIPTQTVQVDTQWKRYSVSGVAAGTPIAYFNVYTSQTGRSLWIDGAQLVEGTPESDAYIAPWPVELTMQLADHPGNVVLGDEQTEVHLAFGPELPAGAHLMLSLRDLYGARFDLPPVNLPAKSFALPVPPERPYGVYTLHGQVMDGAGKLVSAPVQLVWSRLPLPVEIESEKSFFGMHFPMTDYSARLARSVGVRWARLHDVGAVTNWHVVQPRPDQWVFKEEGIDLLRKHDLAILSVLGAVPAWATSNPSGRKDYPQWNVIDKPGALEAWGNYVHKTVEHYKGRINHWGIWNEPWGMFFADADGTPAQFADLSKIAYRQAKAANPDAVVYGIEAQRSYPKWVTEPLAGAGTDSYDIFQYHDYNDVIVGGAENLVTEQADFYNQAQKKIGNVKPLVNSEGGPYQIGSVYAPTAGGLWPSLQPSQAVRFDVVQMAAGVQQYFLYAAWRTSRMGLTDWQATEWDGAIRPVIAARAVLASLVDGAGRPVRSEPAAGVEAYAFPAHNGKLVSVLWSYTGEAHDVVVAAGQRPLDVMSNPIAVTGGTITVGNEPIYLVADVSPAVQK